MSSKSIHEENEETLPDSDFSTAPSFVEPDEKIEGDRLARLPAIADTESPETTNSPTITTRTIHGYKWVLVCISLYCACIIYGLDTTIAADIQGVIVETFGNVGQLTWVGTGFPLGSVCAILPSSALYSRFDMKKLFISSVVLFEAGSAICGAAPTMNALIVGRAIAGVGGSGLYIGILNYFSMLTTEKERGSYMSGIGLLWGCGAILGPVVGGSFSISAATWRWSFYINLLVAAVCAPIYILYLPSMGVTDSGTIYFKLSHMDWTGFVLSAGALVSFIMVLTFAGINWSWNDGRTIAVFTVFGFLLLLTVIQQRFALLTTRENRMFPPGEILRSRSQMLLNIETFLMGLTNFVPLYYIPNYFQFVHNDTAIMAAVRLLPFVIILVTTNIVSGILLPKIGYYAALYLASGVLIIIGGSMMFTITLNSPAAQVYSFSILIALGAGLTFNAAYAIAGIKVALKGGSSTEVNQAVSLQNISQVGGILISLLISGQIFQSYSFQNLKIVLAGQSLTDDQIRSVVAGTRSPIFASLSPELAREAVEAITQAISKTYIIVIIAGGLAMICAFLMKRERLFATAKAKTTSG